MSSSLATVLIALALVTLCVEYSLALDLNFIDLCNSGAIQSVTFDNCMAEPCEVVKDSVVPISVAYNATFNSTGLYLGVFLPYAADGYLITTMDSDSTICEDGRVAPQCPTVAGQMYTINSTIAGQFLNYETKDDVVVYLMTVDNSVMVRTVDCVVISLNFVPDRARWAPWIYRGGQRNSYNPPPRYMPVPDLYPVNYQDGEETTTIWTF